MITIPGNHDSRNVGHVHFENLIGPRSTVLHKGGITFVAVDSSEPDLDHGVVGRGRYTWIEEQFAPPADFRVFILHHHLLPIPGTGRERNVVHDAGDALEVLQRAGVNLVLSGHKHVPYAWRLEDLFVVNAGTVSSMRLRGNTRPCYNVVEIAAERGGRLPQVPVPRPRDDHPLLARHPGLREAHGPDGDLMRPALVLVDGEHYPAVVRAAHRAGRGRTGRWWRLCSWAASRSSTGSPTTACRSSTSRASRARRWSRPPGGTAPGGSST